MSASGQSLPKWLVLAESAFTQIAALTDETRTLVEACWRFAVVFYATSYPPPREQTRTNVNDLDRETLILFEFPARVLRT